MPILVLSPLRFSEMTSELITLNAILVQQHWELELVTESQLGEVQMKPPIVNSGVNYWSSGLTTKISIIKEH